MYQRLKQFIIRRLTTILVRERMGYRQLLPSDMGRLRDVIQPGDVLLVDGSQRISEVIKYLTQSSWSHSALYVGDALLKRGGPQADELHRLYGDEASTLLVEATVETGVAPAPLSKYRNHNVRICRPFKLRPGDLNTVLATVIDQIGSKYNIEQIFDLLRYFFPVTLVPKRFRHSMLEHAGTLSKEVICSAQITAAFQKVRYPVQPLVTSPGVSGRVQVDTGKPRKKWFGRAEPDLVSDGVFTACDPNLVTPRDFDLSPYFEVVKSDLLGNRNFDYRKIVWAGSDDGEAEVTDEELLETG